MIHNILVKYNNTVTDKDSFAKEVEILFCDLVGTVPGVNEVVVRKNCIDRPNRYDLMISIDMDKNALDSYDNSSVHKKWKKDYASYLESKAIFDFED